LISHTSIPNDLAAAVVSLL